MWSTAAFFVPCNKLGVFLFFRVSYRRVVQSRVFRENGFSSFSAKKREDEKKVRDEEAMSLPHSVPSVRRARVRRVQPSLDARDAKSKIILRRRIAWKVVVVVSRRRARERGTGVVRNDFGGVTPTVEEVFNFENLAVFPFWVAMIGFPKSETTKAVVLSPLTSRAE